MELNPGESQQIENIVDEITDNEISSSVILFNDDWHTFDEVINQIIIAVNCSYELARAFSFEVHVKGKAIVFKGALNQSLKVSSILEEIALHTQILT